MEQGKVGDEIAEIASKYMLLPEASRTDKIASNICRALSDGNWDDLNKWHRVRLRLTRLCKQRSLATQPNEPLAWRA
jgi:hypothetical protein